MFFRHGANPGIFPLRLNSNGLKIFFSAAVIFMIPDYALSQTVFWTEDFGTATCANRLTAASSYSGVNGAWTITSIGSNGIAANQWYVSPTEAGMGVGNCGDGCLGTNPLLNNMTLHVGNVPQSPNFPLCPGGDCGAAYDAGDGIGNIVTTNKRAESPLINCSFRYTISVNFNYIENGEGAADDGLFCYSLNGGSTWTEINTSKSALCAGGPFGSQGRWTNVTYALPAGANNNPNVKVGFRWINNDSGSGFDPSYGIDDVKVRFLTSTLPVELLSFTGRYNGQSVELRWMTASEKNNAYFTIEKSSDARIWEKALTHAGSGTSTQTNSYFDEDHHPFAGLSYYRLSQTDFDGTRTDYKIIAVTADTDSEFRILSIKNNFSSSPIEAVLMIPSAGNVYLEIVNALGRTIHSEQRFAGAGLNHFTVRAELSQRSIYILRVRTHHEAIAGKFVH